MGFGKPEDLKQNARIVTYAELSSHYPGSDLRRWVQVEVQDGFHTCLIWEPRPFEPTHRLKLRAPGKKTVERIDFVWADMSYPVAFAYLPQQDVIPTDEIPPAYAFEGQRWQSLWSTHLVQAEPVSFSWREIPKATRTGYVYFIQAGVEGGPIKIGWSCNVRRRLAELQTANATRLVLLTCIPGTLLDEKSWHHRFSDARLDLEWFRPTQELMQAISSL